MRLRPPLGGNHERIAYGVCTAAVNQGHRVVSFRAGTEPKSSMRDACWWQLGALGRKGGYRRRSSAASVGAGLATGDGRPLMPLYRPTPVFEMQPLP